MNPLNLAARLVATVAHEVITEYRKLDAPSPAGEAPPQEMSCTQATTERAWSQTVEAPATAFGFRRQS